METEDEIIDMTIKHKAGPVGKFFGGLSIIIGLVSFVVFYDYYDTDYLKLMFKWEFNFEYLLSMLKEFGEDLVLFGKNYYKYIERERVIDISLYTEFYYGFWSIWYSLFIGIGIYIQMGKQKTPSKKVLAVIAVSLVAIIVLTIGIPL